MFCFQYVIFPNNGKGGINTQKHITVCWWWVTIVRPNLECYYSEVRHGVGYHSEAKPGVVIIVRLIPEWVTVSEIRPGVGYNSETG